MELLPCIASNWNIYEPINHFSRCSSPYAVDTAPIGRRTLGPCRYTGMLHRGSSDFFELLDQGGRSDDSGEQEVQDYLHAGETLVQDAHDAHDTRFAGGCSWFSLLFRFPFTFGREDYVARNSYELSEISFILNFRIKFDVDIFNFGVPNLRELSIRI